MLFVNIDCKYCLQKWFLQILIVIRILLNVADYRQFVTFFQL